MTPSHTHQKQNSLSESQPQAYAFPQIGAQASKSLYHSLYLAISRPSCLLYEADRDKHLRFT